MEKLKLIAIGADPEVFLVNLRNKKVVSAEGLIKGSKHEPFVFDPENKMFTTQLDNVAAEYTIPPANNAELFADYLQKGMDYINLTLPKQIGLHCYPSARFDKRYLQTDNARMFGCDPDFNAYTLGKNPPPDREDEQLRAAGGHIHISYEGVAPVERTRGRYIPDEQRVKLVKALDLFVGIYSVLIDDDKDRKKLYGKAGAFRPKDYGLEYRTLSNFYLRDRTYMKCVYKNVSRAFNYLSASEVNEGLATFVEKTINTNNVRDAHSIADDYGVLY